MNNCTLSPLDYDFNGVDVVVIRIEVKIKTSFKLKSGDAA